MKKIFTIICTLIAILALLASGAIIAGHMMSLPDSITRLHLADCGVPCWANIVPGQTTWVEARNYLQQIYPSVNFPENPDNTYVNIPAYDESPQSSVSLEISDNVVAQINLQFLGNDVPTLQEVMGVYGVPRCWVPAIVAVGWATLIYPQLEVSGDDMTQTAPVRNLTFSSEGWKYCQQNMLRQAGGELWKGFSYPPLIVHDDE